MNTDEKLTGAQVRVLKLLYEGSTSLCVARLQIRRHPITFEPVEAYVEETRVDKWAAARLCNTLYLRMVFSTGRKRQQWYILTPAGRAALGAHTQKEAAE